MKFITNSSIIDILQWLKYPKRMIILVGIIIVTYDLNYFTVKKDLCKVETDVI